MLDVTNKRIVLTGASSDFGRRLCLLFSELGAELFISARSEAKAAAARDFARAACPACRIHIFAVDLRFPAQIEAFALAVSGATRHVDLLVNNAAFWLDGDFEGPSDEAICEVVGSTLSGGLLMAKHFMPLLEASNGADIVNISSRSADSRTDDASHESYAAAKNGMGAAADHLRTRKRTRDVRVTTIYPPRFSNDPLLWQGASSRSNRVQNTAHMAARDVWNAISFALSMDRVCSVDSVHLSNNPRAEA